MQERKFFKPNAVLIYMEQEGSATIAFLELSGMFSGVQTAMIASL